MLLRCAYRVRRVDALTSRMPPTDTEVYGYRIDYLSIHRIHLIDAV
jgi:hypothetical protein